VWDTSLTRVHSVLLKIPAEKMKAETSFVHICEEYFGARNWG